MHTTSTTARLDGASEVQQPLSQHALSKALQFVGIDRDRLSAEEREDHIRDCTRLMEEAYERYERDGFIADRGDADYWMRLRDEAIRGRSAAQVARLEKERGLA